MILNNRGQSTKSKSHEVLLVIAMLFSPFTELRIGPIGVTEIAILFFVVIVLFQKSTHIHVRDGNSFIFTNFWAIFFMLSLFGLFYNYVIRGHISGSPTSMLFDLTSYVLLGLTCFTLEIILSNMKPKDIWRIINKIYVSTSLVIFVLLITSQFTNSIAGFSLNYYGFFRPLARNIHHISMGLAPLPFIGMKLYVEEKRKTYKLLWVISIFSNLIAANATGSLKVVMGFIVGLCIYLFFLVHNQITNWKLRYALVIFLSTVILFAVSLNYETIIDHAIDFFVEEDLSGARNALYSSSFTKILESPIVGYGPGPHAEFRLGSYNDAHQTLLTLGLQGGLFSVFLYIRLIYKLAKTYAKDQYIIGSFIGIFMYSLGGDIIRRLPMWIFLILFYYFLINRDKELNYNQRG